jgi:hypothetical protein
MSRQVVDAALAELSRGFAKLYAPDGRPSIPPERLLRGLLLQAVGRSMRALSRLADVAGLWKCRHPETAHNTVSSYDCTVR